MPGVDLSLEPGISTEVGKQLGSRGHRVIPPRDPEAAGGGMVLNTIVIDPKTGVLWGAGGVATW